MTSGGDAGAAASRARGRSNSGPVMMADRYQALARVGVGGAAVVFRCRDLHTQRIVAVKVLKASGAHSYEAGARFKREARLAATLSHPNIVRVLDYGFTMPIISGPQTSWADDPDRPVPYLAMEYMFGSTLKELVRRVDQLPLDWVWRIGEQLCAALAAAHAKGVVHRDVKPQNVLLLDSSTELLTKLTDFGIARQIGADLTKLTATGQVIGTPDYLSPEQVLGEAGDRASDLYSLGIVLYELITGRLPFEADTPLAAASRRMVADPPALTVWRRDTPSALEEVILTALQRDETSRFRTAQDFAQALRWSRAQAGPQRDETNVSWLPMRAARSGQVAPAPSAPQPTPSSGGGVEVSEAIESSAHEASSTPSPGAEDEELDLSQQSTILRVMTGFQFDDALPPELDPLGAPPDAPSDDALDEPGENEWPS